MFTGIIEDLGAVRSFHKGRANRLNVESAIFEKQKEGDSVSVNGACLTICGLNGNLAGFDVMQETLKKTNLGTLRPGDKVNLERALRAQDRFGGHFVTGHIDCPGRIMEKNQSPQDYRLKIGIPEENIKYVVPVGSVALDGVSLTVSTVESGSFTAHLIPYTVLNTNLQHKTAGSVVNVEFDLIGKYVLNYLTRSAPRAAITKEFLRRCGF